MSARRRTAIGRLIDDALRRRRHERIGGLARTTEELAVDLGISRPYLSQIMSGTRGGHVRGHHPDRPASMSIAWETWAAKLPDVDPLALAAALGVELSGDVDFSGVDPGT